MSQDFPGVDAPASGGASAPGIYLFPFPAGGGVFPIIPEMTGGDTRFAKDYAPSIEGLTNRTNWLFHRTPDFFSGGDYVSGFRALLQFGNTWYLDRSWNNGTEAVVQIYGPTGGGTASLDVFAGGGNGNAIRGTGFGGGAGVLGIGTNGVRGTAATGTNGTGVAGTGDGSGTGVVGVGGTTGVGGDFTGNGGNPAIIARGPVDFGASLASPSTAPGLGAMWADQIVKCAGNVTTSGTTANATVNGGFNIASAFCANLSGGSFKSLRIQMAQAMSGTNYVVTVSLPTNTSGWTPYVNIVDTTHFDLSFYTGGSGPEPVDNVVLQWFFIVVG